jgi:hypothetical protein
LRHVVFDVETNGLLEESTRVHSLVVRDMESDSLLSCANGEPGYEPIERGLSLLSEAEKLYAHNGISFDYPMLQKLYPGFTIKGTLLDTYVTASMRWAHIKESDFARHRKGRLPGNLIGSHKLEAWGYRLGVKKVGVEIEDWSQWTPLMQSRCESDTAITKALVQRIRAAGVSAEAIETEHELAVYLSQQERNGWPFDVKNAVDLQGQLAGKRQTISNGLIEFFGSWLVRDGKERVPKRDNKKTGIVAGCSYSKLKLVEFNPASHDHIANRLTKLYGWTPSEFTASGKPMVDVNVMKGLTYPPVSQLQEYLLLEKRLGQIVEGKEAWLKHITKERIEGGKITGLSHVHGRVIQNKAITHRAAHAKPNVAQVPKVGNPYGAECRALWHVPDGWVQLGSDASGLELRILAHYMAKWDDGAYVKVLLEGDVHSVTQEALIEYLGSLDKKVGRDRAKTFFYAFLYGAGDVKLGKILVPGKSEKEHKHIGAHARSLFVNKLTALGYLVEAIQRKANKCGYLNLIDGRRCYIRHEHAALNSLIQGTGAVICKRWIVHFNRAFQREFGPQGWRNQWAALGWIHDEVQIALRPAIQEPASQIIVQEIRALTDHYHFRCPLDGEAKIGRNWKETH